MKISEILVESKQLNEGPFTQAIGRGFGKVAKGVSNIGKDLKTGFKAGYSGEQPPAAPVKQPPAAPVKQPPAAPNAAPVKKKENPTWAGVKQGFSRAFGSGSNYYDTPTPNSGDYGKLSRDGSKIWNNKSKSWEPYDTSTEAPANAPAAGAAPANAPADTEPTTQQINKAGSTKTPQTQQGSQTMYAQVKANIDKLDKKGKQRIMQLLQKNLGAPATNTPAAVQPAVDSVAPVEKSARKPAKPTQAEIDADRERIMGSNSGESTVRTGKVVAESFSLFRKQ
jgi:hypothetical protein